MPFGLTEKQVNIIHGVMQNHPEVNRVVLFGSRALNTYKPASDVDLALKGKIDFKLTARIKAELDNSSLPYFFDVVDYHTLENPDFKAHIDQHVFPFTIPKDPKITC